MIKQIITQCWPLLCVNGFYLGQVVLNVLADRPNHAGIIAGYLIANSFLIATTMGAK